MRSRLFERILATSSMPSNPTMKRLSAKGYDFYVSPPDSGETPRDVHGIPPDAIAYGRCGVYNDGRLFMDGGANGSSSGHPSGLKWGGYWSAQDVKGGKTAIFVRGRAGVSEEDIRKVEIPIVDWISKNVPRA